VSEPALSSTILCVASISKMADDEQVPDTIIGAVGVCLAAQPRFTTDIDAVIWIDRDRSKAL
jgi:hypothetical protein